MLAWHISDRQQQSRPVTEEPVVPPGVGGVLSVLRSSAVVVNESDVVLKASAPAYAMGLVRGTNLASEQLADLVSQVRRDGQIREAELVMSRPAAPSRHVMARVAPLGSRLVLALVEDRTRERRVESVRRDFVANVSHELKTPVGAIRLLAEAVSDAADDPRRGPQVLRADAHRERPPLAAGAAGDRAVAACRATSRWSRRCPVSLDDVIDVAVDTSAIDANAKRISVVTGGTVRAQGLRQRGAGHRGGRQPGGQRGQLLRGRGDGAGDHEVRRRQRRDLRGRPGHRHPHDRDRPDLRAFLPRRSRPATVPRVARVWDSRSSSTSPPPMAARSGCGRWRARVRHSP